MPIARWNAVHVANRKRDVAAKQVVWAKSLAVRPSRPAACCWVAIQADAVAASGDMSVATIDAPRAAKAAGIGSWPTPKPMPRRPSPRTPGRFEVGRDEDMFPDLTVKTWGFRHCRAPPLEFGMAGNPCRRAYRRAKIQPLANGGHRTQFVGEACVTTVVDDVAEIGQLLPRPAGRVPRCCRQA